MAGFYDDFTAWNPDHWQKADGWTNGSFFHVGWRADHVKFESGKLLLQMDKATCPHGCSGRPLASGEYRSWSADFGYGRYEVRMKAATGSGVVSSFFMFSDPPGGQDEIDIEFPGKDKKLLHLNYYTNGVSAPGKDIQLPFDASVAFHNYAFDWTPDFIKWFVDGNLVHTEIGNSVPLPQRPGQIMLNLWTHDGTDAGVAAWLGPFHYSVPVVAQYEWMRFDPH